MTEFGRLDILVNNAAHQASIASIEEITSEWRDRTMRTNLSAMFYLCGGTGDAARQCHHQHKLHPVEVTDPRAPRLRDDERGDRQLHRRSGRDAGGEGHPGERGSPGPIWTPLIPSTLPVEKVENFGSDTPLGRVGQPAELAGAFVLLASDEASYISGAVIPVTGGKPML